MQLQYKITKFDFNHAFLILIFLFSQSCSPKINQANFIILPDTQYYSEKYPQVLDSQISYILKNAENIDLVIHEGDLTQNNNEEEWQVVREDFFQLNNKIPYVLNVGNHDMGSAPGKFADTRNTTLFNQYFPYDTMSQLPGFAGAFAAGKLDNAYYLLETGNHKWLILTLEFGPRNKVLEWANHVVSQHPDHIVIVNTHSYMYSDSTRQGEGDSWRAQAYGIGQDSGEDAVNDGEQIWQKLIRRHANIRFVFSGHVLNSGIGNLISVNDAGNLVYQFLANYQDGVKGVPKGNGYLRILNYDFKQNQLNIKTYSPYLEKYLEEDGHDFTINHLIIE